MRTLQFVVAYDGTDFHGWQEQPGLRTVQGVLEEAVNSVLKEESIRLQGAGRTDAGVHARGQVASFSTSTTIPSEGLRRAVNTRLPDDVRVRAAADVAPDFHARHSARARHYTYRLLTENDVLLQRIAWAPPRTFVPAVLERALQPLRGEHDFRSFRAAGSSDTHPVCRLSRADCSAWEGGVRVDLMADHFLYHMVRNIVGTALAAAATADPAAFMESVLEARDRRKAGVTAPPQGLCLEEVFYVEAAS